MTLSDGGSGARPPPLDPRSSALLLDIDGTLLEIAARPDLVHVPEDLKSDLARLSDRFGGALALVSGRALSTIDRLFAPLKLAAIGGHGAELRLRPGAREIQAEVLPFSDCLRQSLVEIARGEDGVLLEDKGYALALHYRAVPERAFALIRKVHLLRSVGGKGDFEILNGKCVIELKPAGIDKGRAVRELLRHAPFSGRRPVFLGDDVTDEAAFAVLGEYDGIGISVGRPMRGAASVFRDPGDVRQWLSSLAGAEATHR
jgi:trehalose 6-phosphate phosphatase